MPPRTRKTGPASDGQFTYLTKGGESITLPSMSGMDVDMGAIEDFAEQSGNPNPIIQLGAQLKFLRSMLPDDVYLVLRGMKSAEFAEFVSAWGEHSGTSVGELAAS